MVVIGFYNLTLELISHHFCHVLLARSKSLVIQGEGTIQGSEYHEVGILGAILEAASHRRITREGNIWKE